MHPNLKPQAQEDTSSVDKKWPILNLEIEEIDEPVFQPQQIVKGDTVGHNEPTAE